MRRRLTLVALIALGSAAAVWIRFRADVESPGHPASGSESGGAQPPDMGRRKLPDRSDPARADATPVPAPGPILPKTSVTALEVGSGAAIPGLRVEVTEPGHGSSVFVAAGDGALSLPLTARSRLQSDSKPWVLCPVAAENIAERHQIWAYRESEIPAVVRLEGPPPDRPVLVEVAWRLLDPAGSAHTTFGEFGQAEQWLRAQGMRSGSDSHVAPDQQFTIAVPVLKGVRLRAVAEGYRSTSCIVENASIPVELILRRRDRLSGVITDRAGTPIPGARLTCVTSVIRPIEEVPPDEFRAGSRAGFTVRTDRKSGRSVRQQNWLASADQQGRFVVEPDGDGHAFLAVHENGFNVARIDLGDIDGSVEGIRVELAPSEAPAFLAFRRGDELVADGWTITVLDITDFERQVPFPGHVTDKSGKIPANWFEVGRRYALRVVDPRPDGGARIGVIEWIGQQDIDLLKLKL